MLTYEKDNFYNFFGSRKKAQGLSGGFVWIVGPLPGRSSGERLFYWEAHPEVTRSGVKGILLEREGDLKATLKGREDDERFLSTWGGYNTPPIKKG